MPVILGDSYEDLGTFVGFTMYHDPICVLKPIYRVQSNCLQNYLWCSVSIHLNTKCVCVYLLYNNNIS